MNHGSPPDAQASWDPTRRVNVYAIDNIAQGSETSIPYINIYRTTPVRRQSLGLGEDCKRTTSTLTSDVAFAIVGDAECYLMLQLILDMEARADGMIIGITGD
ncbi:hypothetical protein LTR15_010906 [Elasticomyces elasticus]|nr:hypothetical protein LTR15_010906 [Elasticomyces elasticus]